MNPLMKMLIALIAIISMFFANLLIIYARRKLKGFWRILASTISYLLLFIALLFIIVVLFSPS